MTKRNSNFSIYAHLRMLLRAFPVRDSVAFRMAVAARIEADEATGEVFSSQGRSPRERLQDTAAIGRTNSADEALSSIKKIGLIRGHRIYSRGERQKGGDRLVLDWAKWEDACLALNSAQEACPALSGDQPPCPPLSAGQATPLSGGQATPLSGGQQVDKDTSIVTATVTAIGRNNVAPATTKPKSVLAEPTLEKRTSAGPGAELQMHATGSGDAPEDISWVEVAQLPAGYAQGVYFDARIGKLSLVRGAKGSAVYHSLRDDGFTVEQIKWALMAACSKAPTQKARQGGLEGLLRTYCQYALERGDRAVASNLGRPGAFQRPRMFQP